MLVVKDASSVPEAARRGVLTIGNFDGVHRGHAAVIGRVRKIAGELGGPAGAMLFDPHPRAFFQPNAPLFTLTPIPRRLELLEELGLDFTAVLPFDAAMAGLPAERFIQDILVQAFAVRHVVVGYDFNFGKGRTGSGATLEEAGKRLGFAVTVVGPEGDGTAYSSSRIRSLIAQGHVEGAARLLGRPFRVEGAVMPGAGRGAGLGFPTANITLDKGIQLKHGIYAAWVCIDGQRYPAASYLGSRPTFDDGEPVFETFLMDFSGDLYGRRIAVDLMCYLRGDKPFKGVEALKQQMAEDCAGARYVLSGVAPTSKV